MIKDISGIIIYLYLVFDLHQGGLMKFLSGFAAFVISILLSSALFADSFDNLLKGDFTKQQTIKIRFEVNKRLYSFEAGKFKLKKIKKNRDKIRSMTERIVPWAIMEGLEPPEVARIIVYMYHADEAGASFLDAEDLIPLVSKMDVPIKDFVLMVQYNKETKSAGISEAIRNSFLGQAIQKNWDGISILSGGRGLILARSSGLNVNKAGSLLLKKIPAKGARTSPSRMASIIERVIGESAKKSDAQKIIKNMVSTHKAAVSQKNSPAGLKKMMQNAARANAGIKRVKTKKVSRALGNAGIDREKGVIADLGKKISIPASGGRWQTLSRRSLLSAIKPWLGVPYKFGCKTGRPGIDCSGFTRIVLTSKKVGVPPQAIGHGTVNQRRAGRAVQRKNLRTGDLIFFSASPNRKKITHVGIITGPGKFSHSCSKGVIQGSLKQKWWGRRYVKARRIFANVVN